MRTRNRQRGPRSGHPKGHGCAEQGEALITSAAFGVQGNFFSPKKLSAH